MHNYKFLWGRFAKTSCNVVPLPSSHHGRPLKLKLAWGKEEIAAGKQGNRIPMPWRIYLIGNFGSKLQGSRLSLGRDGEASPRTRTRGRGRGLVRGNLERRRRPSRADARGPWRGGGSRRRRRPSRASARGPPGGAAPAQRRGRRAPARRAARTGEGNREEQNKEMNG